VHQPGGQPGKQTRNDHNHPAKDTHPPGFKQVDPGRYQGAKDQAGDQGSQRDARETAYIRAIEMGQEPANAGYQENWDKAVKKDIDNDVQGAAFCFESVGRPIISVLRAILPDRLSIDNLE